MNNITNKTVVYLLIVAIFVSLVGTLVSLSKLGELSITGLAGASNISGEVNLTIGDTCAITMTGNSINFGSGGINHTDGCILNTSDGSKSHGCGDGLLAVTDGINFTNTGNLNISLNFTSNVTAATFLSSNPTVPLFKFSADNIESGACDDGNFEFNGTGDWTNITTGNVDICNASNQLEPDDTKDTIAIDIYLSIPSDANQVGGSALIKLIGIC